MCDTHSRCINPIPFAIPSPQPATNGDADLAQEFWDLTTTSTNASNSGTFVPLIFNVYRTGPIFTVKYGATMVVSLPVPNPNSPFLSMTSVINDASLTAYFTALPAGWSVSKTGLLTIDSGGNAVTGVSATLTLSWNGTSLTLTVYWVLDQALTDGQILSLTTSSANAGVVLTFQLPSIIN